MWTVLIAAIAAAEPYSPAAVDAFFAEFVAKRDSIRVLEAGFSQTNMLPEEESKTTGRLTYVQPRRIVFRYEGEEAGSVFMVDDGRVFEYQPDLEQLEIRDLTDDPQSEVFFLGFDANTDGLKEGFDITVTDVDPAACPPDAAGAVKAVTLRPKPRPDSPTPFQEVTLYVREEDYLPVLIHVINDAESQVRISVTQFKINPELPAGADRIALPEGVKVFENDQLKLTVGPNGTSVPLDVPAEPGEGNAAP
jgi:outer membrane lipoprotein-sorting protein